MFIFLWFKKYIMPDFKDKIHEKIFRLFKLLMFVMLMIVFYNIMFSIISKVWVYKILSISIFNIDDTIWWKWNANRFIELLKREPRWDSFNAHSCFIWRMDAVSLGLDIEWIGKKA